MHRILALPLVVAALASCSDATAPVAPGFLGGTDDNHEIGLVVNSTGKAITMFQLGSPATQQTIALGTSSTITPVGFSIRNRRAAVPLGNAASVALINLESASTTRFFTFASGNATGSAWTNDTTIIVANSTINKVGKVTLNQAGDAVQSLLTVAPQPTAVVMAGNRVLVVSSNLDENFAPIGHGVITAIDPKTMEVLGTVASGGDNSTDIAVAPDGLAYVVNTGDFVTDGSITIINPATMTVVQTIGAGVAPGAISIDKAGLAYVSNFVNGTLVFDTKTKTFIRGTDNPVCAKHDGVCRGAFAATSSANGDVYQLFFGSPSENLAPYVFVYSASTYALRDSISAGVGPSAIAIRKF